MADASCMSECYVSLTRHTAFPIVLRPRLTSRYVLDRNMPAARRKHIIDHLDASLPFYTRAEFIECLAALTSAHSEEMQRRVTGSNKPLYRLLWCAAAVSRVEWLFDTIRMRARLTPQEASLLSSGTTSNEALHAELNRHFRQTQQVHQATLRLKLKILQHAKLLAHNSAMQRPTTRQMSQASVLARLAARRVWNAKQWRSWCKVLRGEVRARKAHLPLVADRCRQAATVRAWVMKRPAKSTPRGPVKRTAFTRERMGELRRQGVKQRPSTNADPAPVRRPAADARACF